jgi:hypothetical protein
MRDMKDMYGSAVTESERNEMMRQMQQAGTNRANREMRDMAGAAMTRREMKAVARNMRKGKR